MKYFHIFGPVPSRRLGISLGVDMITHKTCSFDCLYCECGKTTHLTTARKTYVDPENVIKELDHYFAHHPAPDYVTFSGSGEPCLNISIGSVISHIRQKTPRVRVAVLTNSSLLVQPQVQADLMMADLVVPSLDAATQDAFERINRPKKGTCIHEIIDAIEAFSNVFSGELWLEILILPGINDRPEDISALKAAVHRICPARVQLNTLDRPGTCSEITPASRGLLEKIKHVLDYPSTSIIARIEGDSNGRIQRRDLESMILETVSRRPCTQKDLLQILNVDEKTLDSCIERLLTGKQVRRKMQNSRVFYEAVNGF